MTELETLRLRNTRLRLLLIQRDAEISQLRQQIKDWKQTAIAALAKAEQMEQDK